MAEANCKIRIAYGTASNWSTLNPVLAAGQKGVESNTGREKVGDGTTPWNSLAYQFYTRSETDTLLSAKANASALSSKADLVDGVVPSSQIPEIAVVEFLGDVSSEAAMLALTGQKGDWCNRTDDGPRTYVITGDDPSNVGNWTRLSYPGAPVSSVNGQVGTVTLAKSDIGLPNVDNTSDANKPVSTAQAAAISTAQTAAINAAATDATTKANAAQAAAVQRGNHTGTQPISTISDATPVGQNLVKLPNPSAIRYLRVNADNTVTALTSKQLREDIGIRWFDKATDQGITAAVGSPADVTSFDNIALEANAKYHIRVCLRAGCTGTGGGRVGFSYAGTATAVAGFTGTTNAASAQTQAMNTYTLGTLFGTAFNTFVGTTGMIELDLIISTTTADTLKLIGAAVTGGQTFTIYADSDVKVERKD